MHNYPIEIHNSDTVATGFPSPRAWNPFNVLGCNERAVVRCGQPSLVIRQTPSLCQFFVAALRSNEVRNEETVAVQLVSDVDDFLREFGGRESRQRTTRRQNARKRRQIRGWSDSDSRSQSSECHLLRSQRWCDDRKIIALRTGLHARKKNNFLLHGSGISQTRDHVVQGWNRIVSSQILSSPRMADRQRYGQVENGNRSGNAERRGLLRVSSRQSVLRRSSKFQNGLCYDFLLNVDFMIDE